MADELKPCPFCGGTPRVIKDENSRFEKVYCNKCAASHYGPHDEGPAHWNTRPAPQPSADDVALVDRLIYADRDAQTCDTMQKRAAWAERAEAEAALLARLAASRVPDGWQLVPVDPTAPMLGALHGCGPDGPTGEALLVCDERYAAMLAAAPAPEVAK